VGGGVGRVDHCNKAGQQPEKLQVEATSFGYRGVQSCGHAPGWQFDHQKELQEVLAVQKEDGLLSL